MTIDLSNYAQKLKLSTQSSAGTPDGNIYFSTDGSGDFELIPSDVLPEFDNNGTTQTNELSTTDGIKFEAIYAFENLERSRNEVLRKFNRCTSGTFKFGGAYNFINGYKPQNDTCRKLIRGSGWNEYDEDGTLIRVYFGNKGLSNIEDTSTPYYQLGQYTETIDFSKPGNIDEAILVYDKDGTDDRLTNEYITVRTFGMQADRKSTRDLGITELGGYSASFAINETPHLTTNPQTMSTDDVYTNQVQPWTGMKLVEHNPPLEVQGFADGGTKQFTWVLENPDDGSVCTLDQCIAYLDAMAIQSENINNGDTEVIGDRMDVWYHYNSLGQIVTQSGTGDGKGLYIEGLVGDDKQRIQMQDDSGTLQTFPFFVSIVTDCGSETISDTNAWFQTYFAQDYDTATAITIKDVQSQEVKTPVGTSIADSSYRSAGTIVYEFDYDGDTEGGTAGTDKDAVMIVEGDGVVTQAKTLYTIHNRSSTINVTCKPQTEHNL